MRHLTYDSEKNVANIAKHGVALDEAEYFEWDTATYAIDERKDYGERRYLAVGYLGCRLYVLIFTLRDGDYRVISLRKANARERKKYEEAP